MSPGDRSRAEKRRGLPDATRIALIEDDLDELEHRDDIRAAQLGKIMWALVGMLISVTTAAVLLVLNLTAVK